MKKSSYKDAGVDIAKGEKAVADVKETIQSTHNQAVLGAAGGFGGLYQFDAAAYKTPVLVASTDGVGTKLRVAVMAGRHDSVGEDLVNHCVNDIAVMGAKPLFFLDYFATAALDESVFAAIIEGFARGCRHNGCAIIGGETAEMPGIYHGDDYDLCGTIVGAVEKEEIVDGTKVGAGDVMIGLKSNGLHTNGYSLARSVLLEKYRVDQHVDELGCTIAEELLRVHRSYLKEIQQALPLGAKAFAHITGGGIAGNSKRVLKPGLKLDINWESWDRLPVFDLIKKEGSVDESDMRSAFNLGIGLVMFCAPEKVDAIRRALGKGETETYVIGKVSASG